MDEWLNEFTVDLSIFREAELVFSFSNFLYNVAEMAIIHEMI